MIIYIKDKVFGEGDILSFILGEHGKAPWDFEFSVKASRDNNFLDNCIYEKVSIIYGGIAHDFTATKIEIKFNENENIYIVSGIDSASRILQNSFVLHDLDKKQSAVDYIKKVLLTFTGISWVLDIERGFNIDNNLVKPVKAGEFLDSWFWALIRKLKCYVYLNGNTIYFRVPDKARIADSYISVERVKEKYYNTYYADVNGTYFPVSNPDKISENIFYAPNLKRYSYSGSFQVDPTVGHTAADTNYWFDNCLEVHDTNWDNSARLSTYFLVARVGHHVAVSMKDGQSWGAGRYLSFWNEKPTKTMMEYLARAIPVYQYLVVRMPTPGTSYPIQEKTRLTGEVVYKYGRYCIYYKDWLDNNGRVISNGMGGYQMDIGYYYGIEVGDPGVNWGSLPLPITLQALGFANDVKAIDTLLHSLRIGEIAFPDNVYTSNYEFTEKAQKEMNIGDSVYSVSGEYEGTCLDKVISYERSEFKYDVSIKDLMKLDVE